MIRTKWIRQHPDLISVVARGDYRFTDKQWCGGPFESYGRSFPGVDALGSGGWSSSAVSKSVEPEGPPVTVSA